MSSFTSACMQGMCNCAVEHQKRMNMLALSKTGKKWNYFLPKMEGETCQKLFARFDFNERSLFSPPAAYDRWLLHVA